jgi:Tol biopolymer transport system component
MKKIFAMPYIIILLLSVFSLNTGCTKNNTDPVTPPPNNDTSLKPPTLSGKLVFHQYDNYGDASKLYLYNFKTNTLTNISKGWNIYDPINAHFNNDGSQIVFMAEAIANGKWDIYVWKLNSADVPINLTANDGCRNEDPKFSPDGLHICFKQTPNGSGVGILKIMDLAGNITSNVSANTIESGMPYYSHDGQALIYARGAGAGSDIFMINTDGTKNHALANMNGIQEYYPITLNDSAFLYTRWYNSGSEYDQVYLGNFYNDTRTRLPFNTSNADYSDAFPYDAQNVILSCDKTGGKGAYDLYIANIITGKIWWLNLYNAQINSSLNELGACYTNK